MTKAEKLSSSNFLLWYLADAVMDAYGYYSPVKMPSRKWGNGFGNSTGGGFGDGHGNGVGGYSYVGTVEFRFNYLGPKRAVLF